MIKNWNSNKDCVNIKLIENDIKQDKKKSDKWM